MYLNSLLERQFVSVFIRVGNFAKYAYPLIQDLKFSKLGYNSLCQKSNFSVICPTHIASRKFLKNISKSSWCKVFEKYF